MVAPSLEEYRRLSRGGKAIPVIGDVLADLETPLSAYWKLAKNESFSFLLESVTGGENLARYSILGAGPRKVIRTKGDRGIKLSGKHVEEFNLVPGEDPLRHLAGEIPDVETLEDLGLPKFLGGAVGTVSYDYVRFVEKLPDGNLDDLQVDDVALMLTESTVVFDHAKNLMRIIVLADGSDEAYERAAEKIEAIKKKLAAPLPNLPETRSQVGEIEANVSQADYEKMVERCVEYIGAGDAIQVVPSLRFQRATDAHPLSVYRALRSLNPSPYMFLLRLGDYDVVGASPEILIGLEGDTARVRPIAGTRPRGATHAADHELEEELLADAKERAEHIMLVDLGRNDLGRVCEYGSVEVSELMIVERYSHVMHIVSDVIGKLRPEFDAIDLVRATFPAGTLSGAPKIRAMEIIDELEPTRRGVYAGAVGYFGAGGNVDLAIAIRTIVMKDGQAYVQAGAGVVFDSVPEREYQECANKAQAALKAVELAHHGLV
jgi:anthranilate synthase component 1